MQCNLITTKRQSNYNKGPSCSSQCRNNTYASATL